VGSLAKNAEFLSVLAAQKHLQKAIKYSPKVTQQIEKFAEMAWNNLKQRSLADSMLIDHDALKELDAVNDLITWSRVDTLLSGIHASPKGEKA
jgi:hypothetical protein